MKTYQEVALAFGWHIVRKEWEAACELLSSDLRASTPARSMEEQVGEMIAYAEDELSQAEVVTDMEEWPDKEAHDVGWAYVALSGDTFSEAATVIVKKEDDQLLIRNIEWGRP